MISTANSEPLLSVKNLRVFFELEHYKHQSMRDVFVSAVGNPLEYFLRRPELMYVVNDVSFEIRSGTRLGIIGTNGSGKTTLCRCLAGMMRGQQGKVETKAQVRAIFDTGTGILPELTGRENAYLLARLFFPEVKNIMPLINEALEFSELGHFVDVPFRQYSKGMQSRLMLSLISAKSTDLLILDEVFDGADVFFQQKLAKRMRTLIENTGATIFVSHSAEQVREVCNQVMVMDKGKIIFHGGVEEGISHYLASRPTPN